MVFILVFYLFKIFLYYLLIIKAAQDYRKMENKKKVQKIKAHNKNRLPRDNHW